MIEHPQTVNINVIILTGVSERRVHRSRMSETEDW